MLSWATGRLVKLGHEQALLGHEPRVERGWSRAAMARTRATPPAANLSIPRQQQTRIQRRL